MKTLSYSVKDSSFFLSLFHLSKNCAGSRSTTSEIKSGQNYILYDFRLAVDVNVQFTGRCIRHAHKTNYEERIRMHAEEMR